MRVEWLRTRSSVATELANGASSAAACALSMLVRQACCNTKPTCMHLKLGGFMAVHGQRLTCQAAL